MSLSRQTEEGQGFVGFPAVMTQGSGHVSNPGAVDQHHTFFRGAARWRHGDSWQAWVHLLNAARARAAALNPSQTAPCIERPGRHPQMLSELLSAADALRWHLENQQPWGQTGWDSYHTRSQRWHDEMVRTRDAKQRQELTETNWTSALPETTVGDITAVPVTNGL